MKKYKYLTDDGRTVSAHYEDLPRRVKYFVDAEQRKYLKRLKKIRKAREARAIELRKDKP